MAGCVILRRLAVVAATISIPLAGAAPAGAFFGLFGESRPEPRADAIPYVVTFEAGEAKGLVDALRDASGLHRLREDAPPDGESLLRRAEADIPRLTDALWGEGYHNATLTITVGGRALREAGGPPPGLARALDGQRGRAVADIAVRVEPGPRFSFRNLRVETPGGAPLPAEALARLKLAPGDPARAADLRAAQARIVDHFRARSQPLTKAVDILATVDHQRLTMDATIIVAPGAVAPIGDIALAGAPGVDPAVVRSFIYAEPGEAYSPQAIADIRKSVLRIPALSSARVTEGQTLDAQGRLPLAVDVTERPLRLIGGSARYSTLDGPALRAWWEHRNLFGGAEWLRLEAESFAPPRAVGPAIESFKDLKVTDLGGRVKMSFMKPALWGTRNDLLVGALIERDRTGGSFGGYTSKLVNVSAAIRHRFSDRFSIQGGPVYERGVASDALGTVDYTLIGANFAAVYDSTDNPLDPKSGVKLQASATPFHSVGRTRGFLEAKAQASAYWAFDEEGRYILAGRLGLGSVAGAPLGDIPANHRFYAGGGGSVRGYRNRSLSPLLATGEVTGGRSLIEASLEARVKVTDNIGVVPFVDVGGAFDSAYPDFREPLRWAAGLGLRYYTGVGPIRLDLAFPLNRRKGDRPMAIYVGIGQAF